MNVVIKKERDGVTSARVASKLFGALARLHTL